MSGIKITSGEIRLLVNDDPNRVVSFNPGDVLFVERFYGLVKEFEDTQKHYESRIKELENDDALNEFGVPKNTGEMIELVKEVTGYLIDKIDEIFGAGTSEAAFQGSRDLSQIEQFFTAIIPFVQTKRQEKIGKYQRKSK